MLWWSLLRLKLELKSKDSFKRSLAVEELGYLGSERAVAPLISALKDPDKYVRMKAAASLGIIGDRRAIEPLVDALNDSEKDVREKAAKALEDLKFEPADVSQRVALLAAAGKWKEVAGLGRVAVEPLLAYLNNHQYGYQATDALGEIGGERAVEPLIAVLKDTEAENDMVRGRAAAVLGKIGDERAVEPLISALSDSERHVRRCAAGALGELGDRRAVEPLLLALNDSYEGVRQYAVEALGKLGDERAIEPIIKALRDSYYFTRAEAASALARFGDARAIQPLIPLLSDSEEFVRRQAKEALKALSVSTPEAANLFSDGLKPLNRLWHAADGSQVSGLVKELSDEELKSLVDSIDLKSIPLNAFCTNSFNYNGLDDRMVATMHLAYRLLEVDKKAALHPLLDKIQEKFDEKLRAGARRGGPSFESKDPWLIGEDLMMKMHTLAMALINRSDPKLDSYAVSILEALMLDYPERLESHFWLAATRHNLYMQSKNAHTKGLALKAIDGFLVAAKGNSAYQSNVEALQNLRRSEY